MKEGLGHWIRKIKEVTNISKLKFLRTTTKEKRDEVLNLAQTPVEKRALTKAFQFLTVREEHPKEDLVIPYGQNQVRLEGNILMSAINDRITDRISRKDKELLQTIDETKFQLFLKKANCPELNSVLTTVFTEITRKFKGQVREQERNITDEERNITEEERNITDEEGTITKEKRNNTDEEETIPEEKRNIADEEETIPEEKRNIADEEETITEEKRNIADEEKTITEEKRNITDREKNIIHGIGSSNEEKQFRIEEEKQVILLRNDIELWIKECRHQNWEELEQNVERLGDIQTRHKRIDHLWQREVLYLQEVQTAVIHAAEMMTNINHIQNLVDETSPVKSKYERRSQQVLSLLRHILHPIDRIQENKFPNLRLVKQTIEKINKKDQTEPFDIQELSSEWRRYKRLMNLEKESPNFPVEHAQLKLEFTINCQEQSPVKSYQYLIFIGVLQIHGFNMSMFKFGYQLTKYNMNSIFDLYESHLSNFLELKDDKEKQAYVFKVTMYNAENKEAAVQYMFRSIGKQLHHWFQGINGPDDSVNMPTLKTKLQTLLPEDLHSDAESLTCAFGNLLQCLQSFKKEQVKQQQDYILTVNSLEELSPWELTIMEALDMKKYYPGKLTKDKVITLTSDVYDDVNKKPTNLTELPWYFIRHVIKLDSDIREKCYVASTDDNDSNSDTDSNAADQSITNSIHPLDLEKVIMMCADDFLRQELMDKMIRCQYAVPFIVPTFHNFNSENLILLWALESVMCTFYYGDQYATKTLVDVNVPLVTFMNLGEEMSWKSRLLKKMLSSQQEMYWHPEMEGGSKMQTISEGLVEVAWFLPGREGDNTFPLPVTFLNVRGNAAHVDVVCDQLFKSSSVIYIFVEDINDEVQDFLHKRSSLERVVINILHSKVEAETMKEKIKNLKEEFALQKHQIFQRTAEATSFTSTFKKIKKLIHSTLAAAPEMLSLREFAIKMSKVESMKMDITRCHFGRLAAQTILKDIDKHIINTNEEAKFELLLFHSKLTEKMAELDKELHRYRKPLEDTKQQDYWSRIKEEKRRLQMKQLQEAISDTFKYFLQSLLNLDETNKKYFLQCLKQGLDERSINLLEPLYKEYTKYLLEDESEDRDQKLKDLDTRIAHGSLGIEHFFREIQALYENVSVLQGYKGIKGNRIIEKYNLLELLEFLPDIMAQLWMDGMALEIMDGDAGHIPVDWLTVVLNKVENSTKLKVFNVSVVGEQSFWKSTLLNTTFGLNFPVSSNRCTRGTYMQLLAVDQSLKDILKCDYVAIIDSEGLMARSKSDKSKFDNELIMFAIGLSDLALVVVKYDGNEIQHILPLANQVFLGRKLVEDNQACHFIFQSHAAFEVITRQATETNAFVHLLNSGIRAVAMKVDETKQYKKLADVLHYDPTKDNTYIP